MAHRRKRKSINTNKSYAQNSSNPIIIVKNYTSSSVQTEDELPKVNKRKSFGIKDLESVARITNFPIVESGWKYADGFYRRIKNSNALIHWTLDSAEISAQSVLEVASPAIVLLKGPISSLDQIVCRSLDIVEQTVPSINLPPEMIYWNTKQYMTEVGTKIAQPVLKRADSVKQIGNTVLESKYTAFAADTLDGALNVADKYVDKYLPDKDDHTEEVHNNVENGPKGKAIHTYHHADRLTRKLKRRLTQRTIAEVKALKLQSAEAVHVLAYVVELIATDPVLAFQKGKELWLNLSQDEPENQARPENLEQLLVLLTRESARRVVHLVNFTTKVFSKVPKKLTHSFTSVTQKLLNVTDSAVKTVHMENLQTKITAVLRTQGYLLAVGIKTINDQISEYLEHVAENLAKQEESQKGDLVVPTIKVQTPKATLITPKSTTNGVENNI